MCRRSLVIVLAILIIIMINALSTIYSSGEDDEALNLLRRLQVLSSKGFNVTGLVNQLNEVMEFIQNGRNDLAEARLRELEEEVSSLEGIADRNYMVVTIARYARVIGILMVPLIFYILFPRIYLYIWFRLRRRWIIYESSR